MRYKMIVLDLDGTLTNDKKEITPGTKEALIQAQAAGVHVVLASSLSMAERSSIAATTRFFLIKSSTNNSFPYSIKR